MQIVEYYILYLKIMYSHNFSRCELPKLLVYVNPHNFFKREFIVNISNYNFICKSLKIMYSHNFSRCELSKLLVYVNPHNFFRREFIVNISNYNFICKSIHGGVITLIIRQFGITA